MPHQYGLPGFAQSPPSPPSQHGALLPRIGGGAVVPGSTGSGSMTNTSSSALFRADTRLTREAMERYMRDRNDKVIVILHAKVKIEHFFLAVRFCVIIGLNQSRHWKFRIHKTKNVCRRVF